MRFAHKSTDIEANIHDERDDIEGWGRKHVGSREKRGYTIGDSQISVENDEEDVRSQWAA